MGISKEKIRPNLADLRVFILCSKNPEFGQLTSNSEANQHAQPRTCPKSLSLPLIMYFSTLFSLLALSSLSMAKKPPIELRATVTHLPETCTRKAQTFDLLKVHYVRDFAHNRYLSFILTILSRLVCSMRPKRCLIRVETAHHLSTMVSDIIVAYLPPILYCT